MYFHYYLLLEKVGPLRLNKHEFPSPKNAVWQVWIKLTQWFLIRRFFSISSMRYYHLFEKGAPFIWTNLTPLSTRIIGAMFAWYWPSGSGEKDFSNSSMYFHYFVIISPWSWAGPFIWNNLNFLNLKDDCAKFGWKWSTGSREEVCFKIRQCIFSIFCNYHLLEKGGALHLNNLEFPSPKDDICQDWLKLSKWFWKRGFLNFVILFLQFHFYLPIGKRQGFSFEQTWILFTQGCFLPILVETGPVVL